VHGKCASLLDFKTQFPPKVFGEKEHCSLFPVKKRNASQMLIKVLDNTKVFSCKKQSAVQFM